MSSRRDFLRKSAVLGLSGLAASVIGKNNIKQIGDLSTKLSGPGAITLPPLPYAADALEPFIDKQTMEIHHGKHHQAYIDKLNTVSADQFDASIDLAESCAKIEEHSLPLLRNNLGGHYNHNLFWTLLKPNPGQKPNLPSGNLAAAINKQFGNFENFKKEFTDKATKHFGSGWCWLIKTDKGLKITTTPNQDNPLMKVAAENGKPVMALDVWEHAYYLKYQNKRAEYITNWWNVANWEKAEELFTAK